MTKRSAVKTKPLLLPDLTSPSPGPAAAATPSTGRRKPGAAWAVGSLGGLRPLAATDKPHTRTAAVCWWALPLCLSSPCPTCSQCVLLLLLLLLRAGPKPGSKRESTSPAAAAAATPATAKRKPGGWCAYEQLSLRGFGASGQVGSAVCWLHVTSLCVCRCPVNTAGPKPGSKRKSTAAAAATPATEKRKPGEGLHIAAVVGLQHKHQSTSGQHPPVNATACTDRHRTACSAHRRSQAGQQEGCRRRHSPGCCGITSSSCACCRHPCLTSPHTHTPEAQAR